MHLDERPSFLPDRRPAATLSPWENAVVGRWLVNRVAGLAVLVMALGACSIEKRAVGPDQPSTPPDGPGDPRIALLQDNAFQIAQGGRYFTWYGCGACHAQQALGPRNLADAASRAAGFDRLYDRLARRHAPPLGDHIPVEQLWQITAYVRSLGTLDPANRRRQDLDQKGEPQGNSWQGPVR